MATKFRSFVMNKNWLETILKKYARDRSVANLVNVEFEPAAPKGANYCSLILRAKFKLILCSGRETSKTVIIKKVIEAEEQVKLLAEYAVFKVETKLFTEILPHMDSLMEEHQDRGEKLWPELIGYNPYDTIIFEDLNEANYYVADRRECLDLNHGLLVLKSLGRFHAMSRILLDRGLLSSDDLKPMYLASDSKLTKRIVEGGLTQVSQVMASSWPPEWKETADRIANDVEGACLRIRDLAKINEDTFLVLNHGDCWICNIMFKYSPIDKNEPISLRFIDFQMSHYNSYGWDLIYFIYSSIKAEDRRCNYDKLLAAYHESLVSTLEFYGVTENVPSLDDVKKEIDRLDYFAFMVITCIYPVASADTNEAFDMEKMKDVDFSTAYNPEIYRAEKYREAVGEEIKAYIKQGII